MEFIRKLLGHNFKERALGKETSKVNHKASENLTDKNSYIELAQKHLHLMAHFHKPKSKIKVLGFTDWHFF